MRAHWHIRRFTREDSHEAIRLLDELLRRQPDNALALADLAFALHFAAVFGWTDLPAAAMARMSETARRAVASDEQDAAAQTSLGIHELFSGQHDNAIRRLLRAIELDPNSAFARGYLGTAYAFGGECDHAIQNLKEAMRLSPRDFLMVVWFMGSAWASFERGEGRAGGGLREAGDRLQSGISGRAWHVCCGLGAPWANGRRARRSRRIHAPDARVDCGGPTADTAVPPPD